MHHQNTKSIIGQSVHIQFPELGIINVPSRIDTGARTSAVWASRISENDGKLEFVLFDKQSSLYTGELLTFEQFETREVTSSNGIKEERYMVKLLVKMDGRSIRARFTLANRSTQKYPVLIGRNVLRGKFVVDIKHSKPLPN